MSKALITIHDAYITYGKKPLYENLSFNIHENSKICLIGKNGAGKTTLMDIISGKRELDGGKKWQIPGLKIGYLSQDVKFTKGETIFNFLFTALEEEKQCEDYKYMVDMVALPLLLNPDDLLENLSGGQLRRAALAKSLIEDPDLLLLDEPTNHLDLEATLWLENFLNSYRGTLICVSHDKRFLANISDKVFWLDRGTIKICPKGFGHFEEWSEMLLKEEERELANRQKAVDHEVAWASRGVQGRRKRNIRRLEQMKIARDKLKSDKSSFRQTQQKITIANAKTPLHSKLLAEFYNVSKKFSEKTILNKFNYRIVKGDRIGILGKNGSGKTSFLKMLIKELAPDEGSIKLADVRISYFDQKRSDLKEDQTLWYNLCPSGGDYINVAGKDRHVCGYLKDFLFDPKGATDLVSTLSGGQKNRLMLAKTLANPGEFLILDEPTNDLDMDTLDMLEEILSKYKGTLFVVSHDRDFLDQTVTKILAFEGDGKIEAHIGGYSDYLEQKKEQETNKVKNKKSLQEKNPKTQKKLSYKLQYELDNLPEKIRNLTENLTNLNQQLSDPDLYNQDSDKFYQLSKKAGEIKENLEESELRWLELTEISENY